MLRRKLKYFVVNSNKYYIFTAHQRVPETIGTITIVDHFVIGGTGTLSGGYLYGTLVPTATWYDGTRDGCIACITMIIELSLPFIICSFNADLHAELGNTTFWVQRVFLADEQRTKERNRPTHQKMQSRVNYSKKMKAILLKESNWSKQNWN